MSEKKETLILRDVDIMFNNFSGKESSNNRKGGIGFAVSLTDEEAKKLIKDGWNVNDWEDSNGHLYHLFNVKINYDYFRPPVIYMVTNGKPVELEESRINKLDKVTIVSAKLAIIPYFWDINGKQGKSAYLKTGYFTVITDEFADEYEYEPEHDPQDPDIPF